MIAVRRGAAIDITPCGRSVRAAPEDPDHTKKKLHIYRIPIVVIVLNCLASCLLLTYCTSPPEGAKSMSVFWAAVTVVRLLHYAIIYTWTIG